MVWLDKGMLDFQKFTYLIIDNPWDLISITFRNFFTIWMQYLYRFTSGVCTGGLLNMPATVLIEKDF